MIIVAGLDKIVADLTAAHATAIARQGSLADERRAIAFAAHTGDKDARIRLDAINAEDAVLVGELASLADALDDAKRRLIDARRLASVEATHERAREVQKRLVTIRKRGADLDKLAATLVASVAEFRNEISGLRNLGLDRPDIVTIDTNFRRALRSALMATPMQLDHLTPAERTTFTALVDRWAASIQRWAEQQLDNRQGAA